MSWTIFLLKFSEHSRDQEIAFTDANPRSICGYVQGLTRLSQRTSWQDERFALDRAASRLLTTVNLPRRPQRRHSPVQWKLREWEAGPRPPSGRARRSGIARPPVVAHALSEQARADQDADHEDPRRARPRAAESALVTQTPPDGGGYDVHYDSRTEGRST